MMSLLRPSFDAVYLNVGPALFDAEGRISGKEQGLLEACFFVGKARIKALQPTICRLV